MLPWAGFSEPWVWAGWWLQYHQRPFWTVFKSALLLLPHGRSQVDRTFMVSRFNLELSATFSDGLHPEALTLRPEWRLGEGTPGF